jgi:hypothetical protein
LWLLLFELVEDLAVRDVAHLVVLSDELALLVAHTILPVGHHGVAGGVCLADIGVDARPAIFALALLVAASWCPVLAICNHVAMSHDILL